LKWIFLFKRCKKLSCFKKITPQKQSFAPKAGATVPIGNVNVAQVGSADNKKNRAHPPPLRHSEP
jgi:hypothetical protein